MRNALDWSLVVFAVVAILLCAVAFWARNVVYDGDTFRQVVGEAVGPERVRRAIAVRAVDAMLGDADAPAARDLLESAVTGLLGSKTFGRTFDAMAGLAWRVLVAREPAAVTLDLTRARDYASALVGESFPRVTARLQSTPTPFAVTLLEEDALPSLAPYRAPATRLAWVLLVVGVAGLVAAVLVGRSRAHTVARIGATLLGGAAMLLLALVLLRVALPASMPSPQGGVVVARALHALTASLATTLGLLAAVGLVSTLLAVARSRPPTA